MTYKLDLTALIICLTYISSMMEFIILKSRLITVNLSAFGVSVSSAVITGNVNVRDVPEIKSLGERDFFQRPPKPIVF